MEVAILTKEGKDTGRKVVLNDEVFGIEPNEHAIYLDVKRYLANHRQGTHKSKERSEVSGSTRKLHKQKGGGGSRIGDINSPVLVGGGRVFGPRPAITASSSTASSNHSPVVRLSPVKANQGEIVVVENFTFETPKTKEFVKFAKDLKIDGKKVLVVLSTNEKNVNLSLRNVPNAKVATASDLNTYVIMDNNAIILSEGSVEVINKL